MKYILVSFIILTFLAKDVVSVSWEIWFYWNQQEISAEKCENKAIPMLQCNGKCYLSKQLKKLEQKESEHQQKSNPTSSIQKLESVHVFTGIEFVFPPFVEQENARFIHQQEKLRNPFIDSHFHPPTYFV